MEQPEKTKEPENPEEGMAIKDTEIDNQWHGTRKDNSQAEEPFKKQKTNEIFLEFFCF